MTDQTHINNDGAQEPVKTLDRKFILILAGVLILVTAAAAPFFGRAAMIVPSILSFCGINIQ